MRVLDELVGLVSDLPLALHIPKRAYGLVRREGLLPFPRAAWDPRLGPALYSWYEALSDRIAAEGMKVNPAYLPVPPPPGCVLADRTTFCSQCGQSRCLCTTLRAHLRHDVDLAEAIGAAGGPFSVLEALAFDSTCPAVFRALWNDLDAGRTACETAGLGSSGGGPEAQASVDVKMESDPSSSVGGSDEVS